MPEPTVEEKAPITNLSDAINRAHEDLDKPKEDEKEPQKVAPKDSEEPEPAKEDELSEEDLVSAKQLFKSLRDPEQAPAVIDFLAKKGGYTKAETKQLQEGLKDGDKEAKSDIVALLEEQFGEEFAKRLAPAIEKAIEKGVDAKTQDIRGTVEQQQLQRYEAEASTALEGLVKEFYGPDAGDFPKPVVQEMAALMETYKQSPSQKIGDYLRDIYSLAAARKGGNLKPFDATKEARTKQNRSDVPSRLGNGRQPTPSKEGSDLPPAKSLDEAIARAAEQLEKE